MAARIASVVLKIAERCNLNCSYCYMYNHEDQSWRDRPRFMSDRVYEAALHAIRDHAAGHPAGETTLIFHGGEPLLVGKRRFELLCRRAYEVLGSSARLTIQTNGTLIDDEWAEIFVRHEVHVGVSIDGPQEIHDAARVDHAGRGSHAGAVRGLERLQAAGMNPAVLCVVEPGADGLRIYRHFRSLGVSTLNFLLPDVSHDNKERLYGGRGPTPVADYLIPIFDTWFAEDDAEVRVRIFWGLLRMLMGGSGETDSFGNPPTHYVVVESDGSIEPLDALKVCEEGLTQVGLNVLRDSFDDLGRGKPLLRQMVNEGLPLPADCMGCPEKLICGGGYYPNRYSKAKGFDNRSVWCEDILKLIRHLRAHIPEETLVGADRDPDLR